MTARPIPCEEAYALLDESLDRPLGPEEDGALRAHLVACAACRRAARDLSAVVAEVRAMEPRDPGPEFTDRVIAALDRGPGPAAPPVPGRVRLARALVGAAGTTAFALLAAALFPIGEAVAGVAPDLPSPPLPDLAGLLPLPLPPWAAAAGALLAAAAAVPVATLRRRP